ncbi:hypothetical protein [Anabaena subtropica]|uniref:Uncharacterized protein n=1 Tax=Anabaena subtropica FACHB-260 TaxID=2692884 RepID=A0ABR8CPF5_9NOST|nr:hypothetical protein [Anabaena subtropica]MBD2344360.1 hypothetical protein [Anabaena subtropica FACHB-260]
MDAQKLQLSVLPSQTLEQLEEEIQQEMLVILKDSRLGEIFRNYNILAEAAIRIQCSIDLTKIKALDPNFLGDLTTQQITTTNCNCCTCWSEPLQDFVKCPCP